MKCCMNSFPRRTFLICLAFLAAGLASGAVDMRAQAPQKPVEPFQKISFKSEKSCTVPLDGEVTALVKNGVELSVTEDFDCDGVPDAYDNCVGMPNRDQADSNSNGVGDVCEAATIVKTGLPVKVKVDRRKSRAHVREHSKEKAKSRKSKAADRRSRSAVKRRRRR